LPGVGIKIRREIDLTYLGTFIADQAYIIIPRLPEGGRRYKYIRVGINYKYGTITPTTLLSGIDSKQHGCRYILNRSKRWTLKYLLSFCYRRDRFLFLSYNRNAQSRIFYAQRSINTFYFYFKSCTYSVLKLHVMRKHQT